MTMFYKYFFGKGERVEGDGEMGARGQGDKEKNYLLFSMPNAQSPMPYSHSPGICISAVVVDLKTHL